MVEMKNNIYDQFQLKDKIEEKKLLEKQSGQKNKIKRSGLRCILTFQKIKKGTKKKNQPITVVHPPYVDTRTIEW